MNQTKRIFYLISKLISGTTLCCDEMSKYFGVDIRTIQRDFKFLRDFFKDALYSPKRGCYVLQSENELKKYINNFSTKNNLKDFFEFITLFDDKFLSLFDTKKFPMIKRIKKETKQHYHILENSIEELKSPFLKEIKEAVINSRYADVSIKEVEKRDLFMIKPLKIVFAQGNWYLATMTKNYKNNNGFKFIRINFILDFKLHKECFYKDEKALKFIDEFQSLFQDYDKSSYEVILQIDAKIARYFKVKKYLKSQKLQDIKENGDLIVTFQINNEMEILPFIKKWLPYVKVLSPKSLDDRVKEDIKKYLDRS